MAALIGRKFMSLASLRSGLVRNAPARFSSVDTKFNEAKDNLNALKNDPGNDVKLQMYALFKQATVGKCNTKKPGMMDFVGKAKWEAWNGLSEMSQDEAKNKYISIVDGLLANEPKAGAEPKSPASSEEYPNMVVTNENGIFTIRINRPEKKNALTVEMYEGIQRALKASDESDSVVTVLTGTGDFYCSGNDLNNFMNVKPQDIPQMAQDASVILERYVQSYIDHDKPLLAVINGPCVGVSCTVLALCDAVYATDKATFHTPFTQLGQAPEGCSSLLFPRIMGPAKANEMLLFNRKLTAEEACARNLVTEVFPHNSFQQEVWDRIAQFAKLPVKSLVYAKRTSRDVDRAALTAVNKAECVRLAERWASEDCMNALMKFFSRK